MTESKQPKTDLPHAELVNTASNISMRPLHNWLAETLGSKHYSIRPAFDGNSHSSYFRITIGNETRMVIDAHERPSDFRHYKQISALFHGADVNVPTVLAGDDARGYWLTTDLGAETYLKAFEANGAARETNADSLFRDARGALIKWQLTSTPGVLLDSDSAYLHHELNQFSNGFIYQHLGVTLTTTQQQSLTEVFNLIVASNTAQASVYVHRDFVPRNLLASTPNPGILSFQNAMMGAISYDIASLYKDVDILWDEERILDGTIRYWEAAKKSGLPVPVDFGDFYRDAEWMGLQRHLKMMGTFTLDVDDARNAPRHLQHLEHLPRLIYYVRAVAERYVALFPLIRLFDKLKISDGVARTVGVSF